ncbi:Dynein heavy chain 9, axonemal [Saguinus oedipus]|uniref:Dynein heavy chain 9, axonemal n=1 Tax=Saguinus oedipus TaxID=9490 RepID=A0ABQ9VPC8_SAGOE|nr:Dynein heavy chain 9, axonemal [Saguinus oedipus]
MDPKAVQGQRHYSCLKPVSDLTKQQNGFKITLKTLEDSLLSRLSSASGNFLEETALVENLEITKQTAAKVEKKKTGRDGKGTHTLLYPSRPPTRPFCSLSPVLGSEEHWTYWL